VSTANKDVVIDVNQAHVVGVESTTVSFSITTEGDVSILDHAEVPATAAKITHGSPIKRCHV
jgi:hypothetical protein